ncbi:response regulator receiver domain [Leptospira sp. 85282-16]|uniref:response regulator receiver domain n=1 Tax=Leptospira sp. 85282-16 TaxID=2971256 RepID=UPI0021BE49C9|nr:response regulator receiver domain [Leptospira sp. 85282-16]MCT8334795.1 response regulator receiver domain [Leptospira sp. 85282-16]
METFEEVKKEIAKDYFKNLVVIDDDCYIATEDFAPASKLQVSDQFSRLHKECLEKGILCHLQYYPKQLSEAEIDLESERFKKYFDASLKVAEQSDILVLDWYLGLAKSCNHSIALINKLKEKGIFKFIVIYTAHPEQIETELISLGFAILGKDESDTQEESERFEAATPSDQIFKIFTNNNIYVSYLPKATYPNSENLFKALNECLLRFSPDLIHWAGLDIANKIDKIVPKLVSRLPQGISDTLAFQAVFKDIKTEIPRHIAVLFIQDIEENLKKELPLILDERFIVEQVSPSVREHFGSNTKRKKIRDLIRTKITTENINHPSEENSHDFREYGLDELNILQLTSFMESFTILNTAETKIDQGTILKNSSESYLLCISPLCDLVRLKENDKVSFLVGKKYHNLKKTPTMSQIQTAVSSNSFVENILWDFKDIQILGVNARSIEFPTLEHFSLEGWEFFGKLRQDVLYRIINRLYSHRSRVGVDQFDIIRQIRDEK